MVTAAGHPRRQWHKATLRHKNKKKKKNAYISSACGPFGFHFHPQKTAKEKEEIPRFVVLCHIFTPALNSLNFCCCCFSSSFVFIPAFFDTLFSFSVRSMLVFQTGNFKHAEMERQLKQFMITFSFGAACSAVCQPLESLGDVMEVGPPGAFPAPYHWCGRRVASARLWLFYVLCMCVCVSVWLCVLYGSDAAFRTGTFFVCYGFFFFLYFLFFKHAAKFLYGMFMFSFGDDPEYFV